METSHSEDYFKNSDGLKIFWQSWNPSKAPKAIAVVVHGLAEHSSRYKEVADHLLDLDHVVYAIDHRGHGKSEGFRGMVDSFDGAIDDIHQLIQIAKTENPNLPLVLLGHSMGGALSMGTALKYPTSMTYLVLSGPAVALDGLPKGVIPVCKFLGAVFPKVGLFGFDPSTVSRDPSTVKDYATDPLNVHSKVPVRTLSEIIKFSQSLPDRLSKHVMPTLLLHGSDDKLAGVSGSKMIYQKISSPDKTLKIYDGLYHEIFNELPADRKKVFKDLTDWLKSHI